MLHPGLLAFKPPGWNQEDPINQPGKPCIHQDFRKPLAGHPSRQDNILCQDLLRRPREDLADV